VHYFSFLDFEQQVESFGAAGCGQYDELSADFGSEQQVESFGVADCEQFAEVSVFSQHFAGGASFLPTNFIVTMVPTARIMMRKSKFLQRLFFFFGVQQPSLQSQFCFELS